MELAKWGQLSRCPRVRRQAQRRVTGRQGDRRRKARNSCSDGRAMAAVGNQQPWCLYAHFFETFSNFETWTEICFETFFSIFKTFAKLLFWKSHSKSFWNINFYIWSSMEHYVSYLKLLESYTKLPFWNSHGKPFWNIKFCIWNSSKLLKTCLKLTFVTQSFNFYNLKLTFEIQSFGLETQILFFCLLKL